MFTVQSKNCQTNDLFPATSSTSLGNPLDNLALIFTGFFNGFNVEIRSPEGMELHKMGWFGKGSLSRSRPVGDRQCMIMRKRQFQKRTELFKKFSGENAKSKPDLFLKDVDKLVAKILKEGEKRQNKDIVDLVSSEGSQSSEGSDDEVTNYPSEFTDTSNIAVVVPNSDSEEDSINYFDNLKAECCVNPTKLHEKLMLTLPEAFFLVYGLGSLQIIDMRSQILTIKQTWQLFNEADKNFVLKYVVYHYFRSKGYIVKPGIKFGGDYLLYKSTPELAHSDYIVVIKYDNDKYLDWISTLGHVRMANTTVKEIIVAEVISPKEPGEMPEGLENYSVRTSVLTRNIGTINEDN